MARVRSGDIEAGAVISRLIAPAAVLSRHIAKYAVNGKTHIRPGSVDGSHLEAQSVRKKHLHPELLPWPPEGGAGACNVARWLGDADSLVRGTTESFDVVWTEDFSEGDLTLSSGSVSIPTEGIYSLSFRARCTLDTIDGGTDRIPVDALCFDTGFDEDYFADALYIDALRTFGFLKGTMVREFAAGTTLTTRVRMGTSGVATGDTVDVDRIRLALHRVC